MHSPRALLASLVWFLLVGVVACGGSSSKLPPTITISPTNLTVVAGATLDVTASYEDADGVTTAADDATWTVAGSTIATVTPGANGHAAIHGVAMGHTTLTITGQGANAVFVIQVTGKVEITLTSIEVTPSMKSIALGTTQQMTATGMYSDASKKDITADVLWATSAPDFATIDAATGVATSVAVGTSTITASLGPVSGTTQLVVTDAELVSIAVTPADASVAAGRTQQFTATGKFTNQTTQDLTTQVTWASSTTAATVSNAAGSEGLVNAVVAGPTMISATKGTIVGAAALTVTAGVLTAIVVTPPNPSAAVGTKRQFTATGTFSDSTTQDLTTQVAWTSSDPTVATIADTGEATAVAAGTTMITATLDTVTGSTGLTVTTAVVVSVDVAPANPSTALGHHVQFTATGTFDNGTTQDLTSQAIWTSSTLTVATVSNGGATSGDATTIAVGTSTITATFNSVPGSTVLTVTAAVLESIAVNPPTANVIPGGTKQFTALEVFSDTHTVDVSATATWASSSTATATVDAAGLATGVAVGAANITATADSFTGTAVLTVLGPSVTATLPRDTAFGIRTVTPIVVTFDQAVAAASVTTQAAAGPCTGSLQLSSDNFATCVGFAGTVTLDATSKIATATPVATALLASTTYKIRITSAVTNAAGGAAVPFTQAAGFTTSAAGACASGLVISQVYGGGGNGGSLFHNDFIELHNGGSTPIDLTGFAVQFIFATGPSGTGSWGAQPLPSVIVPAGGYFLIQESAGTSVPPSPDLPSPDFKPATGIFLMGAASGKVAITATTTPLTGTCPLGLTNDLVQYGAAATGACFEGAGPTAAPTGNAVAVLRNNGGCADANSNVTDFALGPPVPRNGTTAPNVCVCTGGLAEDDASAMSFLSDN
jgi:trimeric autotransporter adhesin